MATREAMALTFRGICVVPDGNPYNNYSFPGNTNPNTGNVAPGNPDTYLRNYYNRDGGSAVDSGSSDSDSESDSDSGSDGDDN